MAYKRISPQPVVEGGTGAQTFTAHGVLIGEGTGPIIALGAAAANTLLQGAGAADPAFTNSPSVSGSITAGTSITATAGNVIITAGNLTLPNTNGAGTQGEITFGGSRFVSNFGTNSCFIGAGSGNTTLSGGSNTAIGSPAMPALTTGVQNSAHGVSSLNALTTGSNNCAYGVLSGWQLISGNGNLLLGLNAGSNYVGAESLNILLNNSGVAAESNAIRIGTLGNSTSCFIQGISGATVTGAAVLCSTTGQLGTIASTAKVKDNIQDIGSTPIMKLRPVSFIYKSDQTKSKSYGLIAEEVEEVFKDLVLYDDNGYIHSVKYHEMPAILLNEIQNQQRFIDNLYCRLEQLEAKINR